MAKEQASREPSWPVFNNMYTAMITALGQNKGQWPPTFVNATLRGGVPEGMLGQEDIPGGPSARGPVYWWHAIGARHIHYLFS